MVVIWLYRAWVYQCGVVISTLTRMLSLGWEKGWLVSQSMYQNLSDGPKPRKAEAILDQGDLPLCFSISTIFAECAEAPPWSQKTMRGSLQDKNGRIMVLISFINFSFLCHKGYHLCRITQQLRSDIISSAYNLKFIF